ncbi:MAG: tetratricopeptide repeat protein [Bacteroidales bacterium]
MKRSLFKSGLFVAGVVNILLAGSYKVSAQAPAQDLKAATLLTRSEAYDKAGDLFKQLIQKEPGNSKYYFYYGENWLQDYFSDTVSNSIAVYTKEAKALYDKGVSSNPAEPLNYIGLAKVAFFNGDNKTADEMRAKAKSFLQPYKSIKKMVPVAKDYAYILAKIAESYIAVDQKSVDTSKALPLLREALKIDYKNSDIYLIAGDIFNIKNDGSNSIKNYNLAQEYDPTSPTAMMKIGSIYVRARNLNAAIPYFEDAIRLNANYAPAYRELGALYSMARRYDEAKKYFEKYLELTQGNIPAKISYVRSLYFAGEYDEVIKNIEDIFKVDQSKEYLNRLAGYSAYEKKNPDYIVALRYMEKLFATVDAQYIIPRDYSYLAKILLKKNQKYPQLVTDRDKQKVQNDKDKAKYAAAATAAEKAKVKPVVDSSSARLARLEKQIAVADKDIDRAFGEYKKALSFDPENKSMVAEIANSYYTYRRYNEAAKMWSKLIALGRNEPKDYMQLGRWYLNAEKYKSADSVFAEVIKKDPKYVDAHLFTARAYSKMEGDPKVGTARPKFEKLIEVASSDTVKNVDAVAEAYQYLAYHYMLNDNYGKAKQYFQKMTVLSPKDKDLKNKGFSGLAQLEVQQSQKEKTIEGKLPFATRTQDWYKQILAYDPTNEAAKKSLDWAVGWEKNLKSGINPNELKGTIKNAAGQPIVNASIRIKDTAAETYSNASGAFKFEIPEASETLVFSAEGYKSKEMPVVRPLKAINVVLDK